MFAESSFQSPDQLAICPAQKSRSPDSHGMIVWADAAGDFDGFDDFVYCHKFRNCRSKSVVLSVERQGVEVKLPMKIIRRAPSFQNFRVNSCNS